ncbi:hypothetical protein O6H91_09G026100 [Diphasiastrum complanatum]|uniref:Uncharacterized protein n=2 Tax=Diphasiastrum complanatum TaxID=34168 RepID=A0ACC2CME3_DIPCM|nr:hypothetical protein O6H91_09G026100 [Diphasiastrum complanatum]KAJ7543131.1 hypothetical protein O6H91_09G026100 [Diphasiastrum complanatum]
MEGSLSKSRRKDSRAKVRQLQSRHDNIGSWRCTTDETDVDEDDEDRAVPMVSEENKRKRAPRGVARKVKLKPLVLYDSNPAIAHVELGAENFSASVSEDCKDSFKDSSSRGAENYSTSHNENLNEGKETDNLPFLDKRRESSRSRMKPFRFRQEPVDSYGNRKEEKRETKESNDTVAMNNDIAKADDGSVGEKAAGNCSSEDERQDSKGTDDVGRPTDSSKLKVKIAAESDKMPNIPVGRDPKNSPHYDEQDLDASLKILKRIMNMESAQPFNTPVDPVVLGIPDYYQVIETPMDFGTIRRLLENREKYLNSQDIYRDIQLIWVNCRKYNHKGDPILEMMKKVQKACSKYWTATGHLRNLKSRKAPVDQVIAESRAREQRLLMEGGKRSYSKDHLDVTSYRGNQFFRSTDSNKFIIVKKHRNSSGMGEEVADSSSGDDDESENEVDKHDLEGMTKVSTLEKRAIGHGSSTISSRRVCGNNHHKDGCGCVVCSGIRRKLAREKKLVSQGKDLPKDNQDSISKKKIANVGSKGEPGRGKTRDGQTWFSEDCLADVGHGDGVAETMENQEELAHYYPASYQMPLKKINPSVLALGQVLFGSPQNSTWSRHRALVPPANPPRTGTDNPLLAAVSTLCCSVSSRE